jgi:hypothetical protein
MSALTSNSGPATATRPFVEKAEQLPAAWVTSLVEEVDYAVLVTPNMGRELYRSRWIFARRMVYRQSNAHSPLWVFIR